MGKTNDLMTGRNQGLAMALKIVNDGGIEALEKEIQYRNLTGVSLNLTKAEMEAATTKMRLHATEVAIVISMVALLEEFRFSKFQVHKFKKTFDEKVEAIINDSVPMAEYLQVCKEQYGIEITFTD
jgi:hypothetical protein